MLMFPFATPCKARGFQSKQLNLGPGFALGFNTFYLNMR